MRIIIISVVENIKVQRFHVDHATAKSQVVKAVRLQQKEG
jgi:hypothetical protein